MVIRAHASHTPERTRLAPTQPLPSWRRGHVLGGGRVDVLSCRMVLSQGISYDAANSCKIPKIYPYPYFLNATGMRRVLYVRNYTHKLPRVFCEAAMLERIAANLCSSRPLHLALQSTTNFANLCKHDAHPLEAPIFWGKARCPHACRSVDKQQGAKTCYAGRKPGGLKY